MASFFDSFYNQSMANMKKTGKSGAGSEIRSFLVEMGICLGIAFLVGRFVAKPVLVKGNSMYPTLKDGTYGVTNVWGRRHDVVERFDVVIVNLEFKKEYIVKRVVGLPGETVSYRAGVLYINGNAVEEPFLDQDYVHEAGNAFAFDIEPVQLKENEYYCLGDNRPHSSDSRVYGPFSADQIMSKGFTAIFPFHDFGVVTW